MFNKLNKRERFLIWFLIYLVIIIVAGYFLILPAFSQYNEKNLQKEELLIQKKSIEEKIKNKDYTIADYTEQLNTYDKNKDLLIDRLTNEELDSLITNLCVTQALKPISLSMQAINKTEEDEENEIKDLLFQTTANITAEGEYVRLLDLIESVRRLSFMRIKTCGYNFVNLGGFYTNSNSQTLKIEFDVFMKDLSSLTLPNKTVSDGAVE